MIYQLSYVTHTAAVNGFVFSE